MSARPGDPSALPPLGPALSRPAPAAPPTAPSGPGVLPPFAPFSRAAAPADEAAAPAAGGAELLPWETPAAGREAAEAAPAPAGQTSSPDAEEALPDWLSWVEPEPAQAAAPVQEAAPAPEVEDATAGEAWAQPEPPGIEDYLAAEEGSAADEALAAPAGVEVEPEETEDGETAPAAPHTEESWAAEAPPGAEAAPGDGPELDEALVGTLSGVADRLEEIARALRERPAEVLGGAGAGSDPLQLLVTGFVLGYAQGRGRAG